MRFDLSATSEQELLTQFRVSTRLDRACSLVDQVSEDAAELYTVQSQSLPGREYTVDLRGMTCDCPDWTYRGSVNGIPCKHIMAAYLAKHRKPAGDRSE